MAKDIWVNYLPNETPDTDTVRCANFERLGPTGDMFHEIFVENWQWIAWNIYQEFAQDIAWNIFALLIRWIAIYKLSALDSTFRLKALTSEFKLPPLTTTFDLSTDTIVGNELRDPGQQST